ncbi:MAG TPA: transcription antitermination factor NusB [Actinomycetota bacterium]|jgi:16S rRNA (cytosine967-C5)-methyltransferase
MSARAARSVAAEALRRVIDEDAYSTLVIPALLRRSGLDARDRRFAAELAYGALRRRPFLDRVIAERATRSLARMSPTVRAALRVGAYQLLFTAVAQHAAVGETVGLVAPRERGFVNAILRRIAVERPALPVGEDDDAIANRTGLAAWGVRELRRLVGPDVSVAAEALSVPAPLCLRTNTCRVSVTELSEALAATGHEPARSTIDPDCLLVERADPRLLPGYREGWFAIQDHASAFAARALGTRPGERVLDACAGPGGKATALACAAEPGGSVVAADLHPSRAGLVRDNAARLGVSLTVLAQDAARPALRGPFDRILVDAPCSGLGSARRRPELLWRPRREDLSRLARHQVAIVAGIASLLRPGGRLVYAVCTFPRAETDAAADAIRRHRPDLRPAVIEGPDGPSERVRLWPHLHGSDGMFLAAFERSA